MQQKTKKKYFSCKTFLNVPEQQNKFTYTGNDCEEFIFTWQLKRKLILIYKLKK